MGDGMLSLSWNNHSATFCHTLSTLRTKDRYTDVTLACNGKFYPVHKLVLSTCSEYFENMFENTPCKHPVIVLRDVRCDELEALLSYMYAGIVSVAQSDLAQLIKVAELLQIKGLAVPDEPPNSNKRSSSDERTSPQGRTRYSASNDRSSPYLRTKHTSSEDRTSPFPKRRRRTDTEDSVSSGGMQGASKTSSHGEDLHDQSRIEADTQEMDSRNGTENDFHSSLQESLISNVQVTLDETLVKEEVMEDLSEDQADAGNLSNSGGSGCHDSNVLIPKYDDQDSEGLTHPGLGQAPPLSEAVIEALAGPSGMQGWPGGGDITRRLALGEGYVEGNQDVTGLALGQGGSQPHHLVCMENEEEEKAAYGDQYEDSSGNISNQCPHCDYATTKKHHMKRHMRTHTGERPYFCPYCQYRSATGWSLKNHLRTHTGEKPYACPYCPHRTVKKSHMSRHIQKHIGKEGD